MAGEGGFPVWGIVLIAVAGAGVIALIVVVVLKKRRAKRMHLLEELEDDGDGEFVLPQPVDTTSSSPALPGEESGNQEESQP